MWVVCLAGVGAVAGWLVSLVFVCCVGVSGWLAVVALSVAFSLLPFYGFDLVGILGVVDPRPAGVVES